MKQSEVDSFFSIKFCRPRVVLGAGLDIDDGQTIVNPFVARLVGYVEMLAETREFPQPGDVDGFVLKSGERPESGLSAQEILRHYGQLAVEDEDALRYEAVRRHFLTRIFAFAELRELKENLSISALADFQRRHKHVLLAYDQNKMRALGAIAGGDKSVSVETAYQNYVRLFREALSKVATHESWANSVEHMFGHFKGYVSAPEKAEFLAELAQYRAHELPLAALLATLRTWCARYEYQYFVDQTLLEPYPRGLDEEKQGRGR